MSKSWTLGKKYKSRSGLDYTLIAFALDGRLIIEHPKYGIFLRKPDGSDYLLGKSDLINSDPTAEEISLLGRIISADSTQAAVKILREIKGEK